LLQEQVMDLSHINSAIGQPPRKATLVGLGELSTTNDIHPKSFEVDVLALDDANDHPAQRFQVTHVFPHDVNNKKWRGVCVAPLLIGMIEGLLSYSIVQVDSV